MKYSWLLFPLLFFLPAGCSEPKEEYSGGREIEIDCGPSAPEYLEDYVDFSDFKYVRLEANDSVPIGGVRKAMVFDGRIYVEDHRAKGVYIFDREGKFIKKPARLGSGEQEFARIGDFQIDRELRQLIVLDGENGTLTFYDLDGDFIRRDTIGLEAVYFETTTEGYLFYQNPYYSPQDDVQPYHLIRTDKQYRILERLYNQREVSGLGIPVPSRFAKDPQGNVLFAPVYSPFIFRVAQGRLTPEYRLKYSRGNVLDVEDLYSTDSDPKALLDRLSEGAPQYFNGWLIENGDQLCLQTQKGLVSTYTTYFDKANGRSLTLFSLKEDASNYRNILFHPVVGSDRGYYISAFSDPSAISLMKLEQARLPEDFKNAVLQHTDQDNPLLIFYKLKDF